jgi:hypothetical protein
VTAGAMTVRQRANLGRGGCPVEVSGGPLGGGAGTAEGPAGRTGLEVPRRELGRRAVRLLVDPITGARRTDQRLLECVPVPGATVGPV